MKTQILKVKTPVLVGLEEESEDECQTEKRQFL